MDPLSERQERCIVALLEIERTEGERGWAHRNAGAVARLLGFGNGPIQHGNGAKSKRSFSGTGALGKWTYPPLRGLEQRGLVRSYYDDRGRYTARIKSYELTDAGREEADRLITRGVVMRDPNADKAHAYGAAL